MLPGVGWALLAAGLWDWWNYQGVPFPAIEAHHGFTSRGLNCGGPEDNASTVATTAACNPVPVFYSNVVNPAANVYSTFYESIFWGPGADVFRGRYAETYDRNVGYVGDINWEGTPAGVPYILPRVPTLPEVVPAWDPFAVPVNVPQPAIRPIPYHAIPHRPVSNPWRAPAEQPARGPAPRPAPQGRGPGPRPSDKPSIDTRWPRSDGKPKTGPGWHRPGRPGKGTKEPKWKAHPAVAWAFAVAVAATEAGDLIEALYGALPDELQDAGPALWEKAKAIYDHADAIDPQEAIAAVLAEKQGDRAYGKWFGKNTPPMHHGPGGVVVGPHGARPSF